MGLLQVVGIAALAATLVAALKDSGSKYTTIAICAGGILLSLYAMLKIEPMVDTLTTYLESYGMGTYTTLLLKALGIGYLTQIGADICKDLGAEGIASKLELCGHIELLVLCLPLVENLLDISFSLVSTTIS